MSLESQVIINHTLFDRKNGPGKYNKTCSECGHTWDSRVPNSKCPECGYYKGRSTTKGFGEKKKRLWKPKEEIYEWSASYRIGC